ncbi:receptor-like protein kinase [Dorcoceras hygrometricum]|uniref:non-specific serine/threonine protein kinase n=1 Tax=Dorcoceras hygrometricum TaxID=472368 RepID=A0A2Z7CI40_9LAMI|nr:receptor-like protein kinase [Dorcoceras hygrometricum]
MASRQPYQPNSRPKSSIILLAITVSTSLIVLFSVLYFLCYFWYSLLRKSRTSPFDSPSPSDKLKRFSYKELKNATQNFSASNSIGKGGSGTVFRGILKDGKLVAVKLLDSSSFQGEQEFQNELKILEGLKYCPLVVSLSGFCAEKGKKILVYEYMPNRSLQECLFSESKNGGSRSLSLTWARRFSIILDVARALAFLHLECEPAVIHGDVKPSNVLLDSEFRAKISDFGLSRLKLEGKFGIDLFSQDLWKSQELSVNSYASGVGGATETPVGSHENDEVDFALALQASTSSKNSCKVYHNVMGLGVAVNSLDLNCNLGNGIDRKSEALKGKELSTLENGGGDWNMFVPYDDELSSIDHSKELNLNVALVDDDNDCSNEGAKQWGKDWWWRQDGDGELCSKDYVMEWIGSQICPSTNTIWDEEKGGGTTGEKDLDNSTMLDTFEQVKENKVRGQRLEPINGIGDKERSKRWKVRIKKHRKMHEWWREEHLDELRKKSDISKKLDLIRKNFKVPHFSLAKRLRFGKRKFHQENNNTNESNKEFSFRKGWRKTNSPSVGSDMWSGDLFSRELSSTTSMRGTLCYVAPELGGCGYLMEKADIYSFGVLILVIISGRRPLHVLSSPMKLEKANLISWCRHLAHSGNVLELVDERMGDEYDKNEARLCINVALACLQKMPELRPDIGDVVKILKGEMELPSLPFEFSPSPPSKVFSSSRKKQKGNQEY